MKIQALLLRSPYKKFQILKFKLYDIWRNVKNPPKYLNCQKSSTKISLPHSFSSSKKKKLFVFFIWSWQPTPTHLMYFSHSSSCTPLSLSLPSPILSCYLSHNHRALTASTTPPQAATPPLFLDFFSDIF